MEISTILIISYFILAIINYIILFVSEDEGLTILLHVKLVVFGLFWPIVLLMYVVALIMDLTEKKNIYKNETF